MSVNLEESTANTLNSQLCDAQPCETQHEFQHWYDNATENEKVDWLIQIFNTTFAHKQTELVRSDDEPEYFAPVFYDDNSLKQPARIAFAHGFFASALHEISHWCIAGKKRRLLDDFGYWYEPDGRTKEQQQAFEQVEIKPQAIEWLFTHACKRTFRVSVDNLSADNTDDSSEFKYNVHQQLTAYITNTAPLPKDAQTWLQVLCNHCRPEQPLCIDEFQLANL